MIADRKIRIRWGLPSPNNGAYQPYISLYIEPRSIVLQWPIRTSFTVYTDYSYFQITFYPLIKVYNERDIPF
jgi:hypothetical protein